MKRVPHYFIEFERTDTGDRIAVVHVLRIPEDVTGGRYRQLLSMEAFHKAECKKVMKRTPYERRYSRKFADEVHDYLTTYKKTVCAKELARLFAHIGVKRHDSLWDFYQHIGYNYKFKRYEHQAHS